MHGAGTADDLALSLPGGRRWVTRRLSATIDSLGNRRGGSLWLQRGSVQLDGDNLSGTLELTEPTDVLDSRSNKPLRLRASGDLMAASALAAPWWPAAAKPLAGRFELAATAQLRPGGPIAVRQSSLSLDNSAWQLGATTLTQNRITADFGGLVDFSAGLFRIDAANIVGETASAGLHGRIAPGAADVEVAWRVDLGRIRSALGSVAAAAGRGGVIRPVSVTTPARPPVRPAAKPPMTLAGVVDGRTEIFNDQEGWRLRHELLASDVALTEPPTDRSGRPRTLWAETEVQIDGVTWLQPHRQSITAEPLRIRTGTLAATLEGRYSYADGGTDVRLAGPVEAAMDPLSARVSSLAGTSITATGLHRTDLSIAYAAAPDGRYAFNVETSLGWDRLAAGGMIFGPAVVDLAVDEQRVRIAPVNVTVVGATRRDNSGRFESQPSGQPGTLRLSGDLVYRPALRLELPAGRLARDIELTPDLTAAWLRYLAPIASDAAQIQGRFGIDIDDGVVDLEDARGTRLTGRLGIDGVQMQAGPLADQTIAAARQIQSFLAIGSAMVPPAGGRTLVTLPPQTVDFTVAGGAIDHRALRLQIGSAEVITGGRVTTDGRLDLTAQVPLQAKWLGADLRRLAGQSMTLPVTGTLQQPRLDTNGIRRVAADLGTQAVQGAAENYLQEQVDRGLGKLFGR